MLLGVPGRRLLMGAGALGIGYVLSNMVGSRESISVRGLQGYPAIGNIRERLRERFGREQPEQPPEETKKQELRRRIEAIMDPNKLPRPTEATKNELLQMLEEGRIQEVEQIVRSYERRQASR